MMSVQSVNRRPVAVTIGYAARPDGKGVAFAALDSDSAARKSVRIPFALQMRPALQGRDVSYAAANAVAEALLERGLSNVTLQLEDGRLATDLRERGALPAPLTVPYVALRCRLNRFEAARVEAVSSALCRDLTGRAKAEASLDIAA